MNRPSKIRFGDILRRVKDGITIDDTATYSRITIRMYGKGVMLRDRLIGADIGTKRQFIARAGQFVLSKIDARNGAFGVIPKECDNAIVTGNFWVFDLDVEYVEPHFFEALSKTPEFVASCISASDGTTNRLYLQENSFLSMEFSFPPLDKQRAIVAHLDSVAEKIRQVEAKLDEIEADAEHLLSIQFHKTIKGADWRPMAEVAPLVRREVKIDLEGSYPELGIRSFGKGTFHKPPLSGADVGSKRLFGIEPDDLIFSNVFAWEGAIAVVKAEDTGRFGSHRFITCNVDPDKSSPEFLRYYFLTSDGMEKIGIASPGGAGRNRTLGLGKLMAIQVPVPEISKQQAFDTLQSKIADMKAKHQAIRLALKALLPSMLEQIFT